MQQAHEALKTWEEVRRARDTNDKAIAETMLFNMEQKVEQGKNSCADLLKYVKEVANSQRDFVKNYGKLGVAVDETLHYGTLNNAVVVLKKHNLNSCNIYEEHNKILNDSKDIASSLSSLVNDYTKQGTKVLETAQKLGKDLDQARETTHKNFAAYQQAYEEYVTITEKNSFGVPTRDPWMAERVYLDSLATMKIIKDKFSTEMGQLFEKFLKLEEKRVEATKNVLLVHVAKQKLILGKLTEGITELATAVEGINTAADRQLLIKQNFNRQEISTGILQSQQQKLATPAGAQVPILARQYEQLKAQMALSAPPGPTNPAAPPTPQNAANPARMPEYDEPPKPVMQPTKSGFLQRQSSVIKSWKKNYFTLTNGFLYVFVNQEDRVPEYTLSLQTISIMHLKDYEEPHVFEIIVNPGAFFSSQRYLFKAENEEIEWVSAVTSCSGSKK